MISLAPYSPPYGEKTIARIADFFDFHEALVKEPSPQTKQQLDEARETLQDWQSPPNSLFLILKDGEDVGFLRLRQRGPIAVWLEDIYVDRALRGQGIATAAIGAVEDLLRRQGSCEALCLDVAPRNADALRLYHKLGFVDLSLLTLRKELGESRRDRPLRLFDLDFKY